MTLYVTVDGEMLDQICKAELGDESHAAAVLDQNPHLADLGPVYAAGVEINLPDRADLAAPATTTIRLWGKA